MGEAPVGVVTSNPVVGKADKTSSSDLSWGERARADLRTAMDAKKPGAFDEMVKILRVMHLLVQDCRSDLRLKLQHQ